MQAFIANNKVIIDTTSDGSLYKFYNIDDSGGSRQNTGQQAAGAGITQDIITEEEALERAGNGSARWK